MSNELFKDLLDLQADNAKDPVFTDDLDIPFDLDPMEDSLAFMPHTIHEGTRGSI